LKIKEITINIYTMKKRNFLSLAAFIVLVAMNFQNVVGQQTQTTIVGATHNYSVVQSAATGASTYTWSASVVSGSGITYTFGTTNTNSVTFDNTTGSPYRISIAERSSNGCDDPVAQYIDVTVNANNTGIEFASDGVAPFYARGACAAASGNLTLALTLSGNIPHPCAIVVNYTVAGVSNTRTINSTSATTATIDLGTEENILVNATTSDITRNVIITSASIGGAAMTLGTQNTYAFTAWLTPATSTITVTP
jgi:hypothetical protein